MTDEELEILEWAAEILSEQGYVRLSVAVRDAVERG